jgi:SulP family sulfate permease
LISKIYSPLFFGSVTQFREIFNPRKEQEGVVVLDFMESRVWDSSALEIISEVVEVYQNAGKEIHIRHLSPDCQRLLTRAGDLYNQIEVIEVDASSDPSYGVSVDYDTLLNDNEGGAGGRSGSFSKKINDTNRMERAIQRQYSQENTYSEDDLKKGGR